MLEIIKAGGVLMIPIVACSVIALAIIAERFWTLKEERIMPPQLVAQIWQWSQADGLTLERVRALRMSSPLGNILAVGLHYRDEDFEVMKSYIEDAGRHVAHELERFLNTLGTVAAITPMLGLLGTVLGMIQVFAVITDAGVGDPTQLAGGISQALITTAAGLIVAIPALIFYRFFKGRVEALVISMEQETIRLIELMNRREKTLEVLPG